MAEKVKRPKPTLTGFRERRDAMKVARGGPVVRVDDHLSGKSRYVAFTPGDDRIHVYWSSEPSSHPGVQVGRDEDGRWHTFDMDGNPIAVTEPDND